MTRARATREEVPEANAGVRLDQFLAESLEISRGHARRLLEEARVRVGGRQATIRDKGRALAAGTAVEIEAFRSPEDQQIVPQVLDEATGPIARVLARGQGWLAVDKRAGAPVHPLREQETATVLNVVAAMHPEVQGVGEAGLRSGVVHRLDVDTSGVLLVATAQPSWERLREAFREHRVEKRYRAIVAGALTKPIEQEVGLVVAQHRPARVRVVEPGAVARTSGVRVALQRIVPLEQFDGASLVEVRPRTGFLHQIRATLAALGHPVLGDATYAGAAQAAAAAHHQLHAAALRFEEIEATSPDPEDFAALIVKLRSSGV